MSIKLITQVLETTLEPTLRFILVVLADHANDQGRHVYPSQRHLADRTGYDVRTVQRTLRKLEALTLLRPISAADRATARTAEYAINVSAVQLLRRQDAAAEDTPPGTAPGALPVVRRVPPGTAPTQPSVEPPTTRTTTAEPHVSAGAAPEPAAPEVLEGELITEPEVVKANDVIREYSDGFARKFGARPIITGQDAGAAKQLARKLAGGAPVLRRAVDRFFNAGVGWWVEKNAYTFNVFISCYNSALAGGNGNADDARVQRLRETARSVLADHGVIVGEDDL